MGLSAILVVSLVGHGKLALSTYFKLDLQEKSAQPAQRRQTNSGVIPPRHEETA